MHICLLKEDLSLLSEGLASSGTEKRVRRRSKKEPLQTSARRLASKLLAVPQFQRVGKKRSLEDAENVFKYLYNIFTISLKHV